MKKIISTVNFRLLKNLALFISFQVAFPIILNGQVSYGGKPYPYESKKSVYEVIRMPVFDYNLMLKQIEKDKVLDGKKPLPVAWNYEVDIDPYNAGTWQTMTDNIKLWRIEILSEGAYAMGIIFKEFYLENGVSLFVYDPAQDYVKGKFDYRSNKSSGTFPVSFIPGSKIIVELQVPDNIQYFGKLKIGTVSHTFVDLFGTGILKDSRFGKSEDCNVDINCPSGNQWQEVKRAVCRIIFTSGSTSVMCTGTLINNTEVDGTPYLLTANHCISKSTEAQSAIFYFGYESPECNGPDGTVDKTLAHSELKVTSDSLDFSLLLISEEPPETYNPYFAGWTITTTPSPSSVCIHHPQGDVKKISVNNEPVTSDYQVSPPPPTWLETSTPQGFWRVVRWDEGATQGGSSGAPLFNNYGLIVGNLTGGDASCLNPENDYFSKFYMNWNYYTLPGKQLKPWLDKEEKGRTTLLGYDPFFVPDTNSNIMDIIAYSQDHKILTSAITQAGLQDLISENGPFTFFAPDDQAFNNLVPGTLELLFSDQYQNLPKIIKNHMVNNELLSFDLFNGMKLLALSEREISVSENENGTYYDYAKVTKTNLKASNGVVHFIDAVILPIDQKQELFNIFPNPAVEDFWILSAHGSINGAILKLYNINGSLLADYVIEDEKLARFSLQNFPSGIYVIEIIRDNKVFRKKLIIAKPNH